MVQAVEFCSVSTKCLSSNSSTTLKKKTKQIGKGNDPIHKYYHHLHGGHQYESKALFIVLMIDG
jgi:hypothetical protein